MRVTEVIETEFLQEARLVAGHGGIQRRVSWVHIVDLPEPGPWTSRDQLLLTTGHAWSNDDVFMRNLIRELDSRGIAGVALAVPSYFTEFPDVAKREADRVGLPLLEIPWEIPFGKISEGLNRAIINEQQRDREQADAIHRALTRSSIEADTLDEIVSAFSTLIERTVVLEDADGKVIASRAHGEDPAQQPHASAQGLPQSVAELLEMDYWATVRQSQNAARVPWNTGSESGSLVVCPVWLKRELVGVIWIPEESGPLDEMDIRAAEHAATVIALYIARERAVVNVEQRLRFSLIDSLLEGQFTGDTIGLERATLMGFDPAADYKVAIFVLEEPVPLSRHGYLRRERFVNRLTRRMTQLDYAPLISPSLNEISVVLPAHLSMDLIGDRLLDDNVVGCVGRSYEGIGGVKRSYREARATIEWATPNTVTSYEDILLPRLLQGDREARDNFIADWLDPLRGALHGDVYVSTLRTLSVAGFNQRQAAEKLSIHTKTMQYRVNRIQDILGVDLAEPKVRFQMYLLFELLDMNIQQLKAGNVTMRP